MVTGLSAHAAKIEFENPDIKARWDTTVGYSLGVRTERPSDTLTQGPDALGFNDGDLNFSKRRRPITNRLDLFSEADVSYRGFGARVSAAGWYDAAYTGSTSNTASLVNFPPPQFFNQANTLNSGSAGQFDPDTKKLHGRKAELLDAFVFGRFDLGEMPLNVKLGKHAVLWGESLFFGANAIAGGMAPIDIMKALSSPNATIKEIVRPVEQLSAQMQVAESVSVGAFYQFKWEASRLPAVGSFYSTNDSIGDAARVIYSGTPTPGGPVYLPFAHKADDPAPNSGQFGVQTHFRLPISDADFGLYAIQFSAKLPVGYLSVYAPPQLPDFRFVYPEKIKAFGASVNTTVGVVNLGAEASIRTNSPLTRGLMALTNGPGASFNASGNPDYGVGRTAHVNVSTLTSVPSYFLARESSLAAEVAWNRVLSCQLNCVNTTGPGGYSPRDANSDRDAWGFRLVYTPTYRQVINGVDLSVPLGLSYSPKGKSGVLGPIFVDGGGDMSIGLQANVRESFTLALSYTHYYGASAPAINSSGFFSFKQAQGDRDNVTFSARMSF